MLTTQPFPQLVHEKCKLRRRIGSFERFHECPLPIEAFFCCYSIKCGLMIMKMMIVCLGQMKGTMERFAENVIQPGMRKSLKYEELSQMMISGILQWFHSLHFALFSPFLYKLMISGILMWFHSSVFSS